MMKCSHPTNEERESSQLFKINQRLQNDNLVAVSSLWPCRPEACETISTQCISCKPIFSAVRGLVLALDFFIFILTNHFYCPFLYFNLEAEANKGSIKGLTAKETCYPCLHKETCPSCSGLSTDADQ